MDPSRIPPEVLSALTREGLSQGDRLVLQAYVSDPQSDSRVAAMARQMLGISAPEAPSLETQFQAQIDQPMGRALPGVPQREAGAPPETWAQRAVSGTMSQPSAGAPSLLDQMMQGPRDIAGAAGFGMEPQRAGPGFDYGGAARQVAEGWLGSPPRPASDNAPGPTGTPSAPVAPGSSANDVALSNKFAELGGEGGFSGSEIGAGLSYGGVAPGSQDWIKQREAELQLFDPASAFAGTNSAAISSLANNPELASRRLYEGAPGMAAAQAPTVQAMLNLAKLGLLTEGGPEANMMTGQGLSNVTTLEQVEALRNAIPDKGAQVDPYAIWRTALDRALATDPETMFTGEGGVAGDPQNQIAVTNGYLVAAKPFLTEESQGALESRLNQMAMEYMDRWSRGEVDVSYPEYLRQMGAEQWLGG
jgi:hypothetical protein